MRRSTFLTFAAVILGSTALASSSAFAADAGTYRPGNAYNSITANSPDVCDMQCSGDAQCRSWNFVRISEMSDGVCEFNDTLSTPVPSAISISGNNASRARTSRIVAGNTNTVRVGAPSVTQGLVQRKAPSAQKNQTRAANYQSPARQAPAHQQAASAPSLMQQQRMNGRRAMPNAAQRATPLPQYQRQSPARPAGATPRPSQFRHSLEEGRPAPNSRALATRAPISRAPVSTARTPHPQRPAARQAAPQVQQAPSAYAHADPRLQRKLQQRIQNGGSAPQSSTPSPTYPPAAQATPPRYAASAGGLSAPPGVPPIGPQIPNRKSSYASPSMAGAPTPPRRVTIPSELSPRPMGSGGSLFGSLYDDVKVPRPVDPSIAADPDAPIPTVNSAPASRFNR